MASEADDADEAVALKDEAEAANEDSSAEEMTSATPVEDNNKDESDPFGLDALIPRKTKKDDRTTKGKKDSGAKVKKEEEDENRRFLKSQREALITCLEIAARRYKTPW